MVARRSENELLLRTTLTKTGNERDWGTSQRRELIAHQKDLRSVKYMVVLAIHP